MSKMSFSLKLALALVVVCLCDLVLSEKNTLNRQKRGFRQDAATRVAHGYGKRGDMYLTKEHLRKFPGGSLEDLLNALESASDGSRRPEQVFEELIETNPRLARFLIKKYATAAGDDLSVSELLSRHRMKNDL